MLGSQCSEMGGGPVGKADSRALQPEVLIQWTVCMVVKKNDDSDPGIYTSHQEKH